MQNEMPSAVFLFCFFVCFFVSFFFLPFLQFPNNYSPTASSLWTKHMIESHPLDNINSSDAVSRLTKALIAVTSEVFWVSVKFLVSLNDFLSLCVLRPYFILAARSVWACCVACWPSIYCCSGRTVIVPGVYITF